METDSRQSKAQPPSSSKSSESARACQRPPAPSHAEPATNQAGTTVRTSNSAMADDTLDACFDAGQALSPVECPNTTQPVRLPSDQDPLFWEQLSGNVPWTDLSFYTPDVHNTDLYDEMLQPGMSVEAPFDFSLDANGTSPSSHSTTSRPATSRAAIHEASARDSNAGSWPSHCPREPAGPIVKRRRKLSHSSPRPSILNLTPPDHLESAFDRYLFNHYWTSLSMAFYPISINYNPYRAIYAAISQDFPPLTDAILCASASHLTEMGRLPPGTVETYRQKLRNSFRRGSTFSEHEKGLAATVLFNISSGVIGTGLEVWTTKLRGARQFLASAAVDQATQASSAAREQFRFLRLQHTWMAAVGRSLFPSNLGGPEEISFVDDDADVVSDGMTTYPRWFQNMTDYACLTMLSDATRLAAQLSSLKDKPPPIAEVQAISFESAQLLQSVLTWTPAPAEVIAPFDQEADAVNEIWRQGLLCYIYATLFGLPSGHDKIQQCLTIALPVIFSLSWINQIQWPLFMVAVHILDEEDRFRLGEVLQGFSEGQNFRSSVAARGLLEEVWDNLGADGYGLTSFQEIMRINQVEFNMTL